MTSGKLTKKPDDFAREKLMKRARKAMIQSGAKIGKLTHAESVSPSQRKSELGRERLNNRPSNSGSTASIPVQFDCRGCEGEGWCGFDSIEHCEVQSRITRCKKCGVKVRFRVIESEPYEYCPICRERVVRTVEGREA